MFAASFRTILPPPKGALQRSLTHPVTFTPKKDQKRAPQNRTSESDPSGLSSEALRTGPLTISTLRAVPAAPETRFAGGPRVEFVT